MGVKKQFEGIEINGMFVDIFIEAFKLFPSVVVKRMVNFGIGTMQGRDLIVDRNGWYPLDQWLAAHEDVAQSVGPRAAFSIGQQLPKVFSLPPQVADAHAAISTLNIIYHTAHRKNGRVMF